MAAGRLSGEVRWRSPSAFLAFSTNYTSPRVFIFLWVARRADCARRARVRALEDPVLPPDLSSTGLKLQHVSSRESQASEGGSTPASKGGPNSGPSRDLNPRRPLGHKSRDDNGNRSRAGGSKPPFGCSGGVLWRKSLVVESTQVSGKIDIPACRFLTRAQEVA